MNDEEYEEAINELKNLRITIEDLEEELEVLKEHEVIYRKRIRKQRNRGTGVCDRDGTPIWFGDKVTFLTKGLYGTKEGIVYKVSSNKSRITAKDEKGNAISRAPKNVRVSKASYDERN